MKSLYANSLANVNASASASASSAAAATAAAAAAHDVRGDALPAVASASGREGAGEAASTSAGSGAGAGAVVSGGRERREGERVPSGRLQDLSLSSARERRDGKGGVAWVVASSGSKLQLGGQLPVGRRGGRQRAEEGKDSPRVQGVATGLAHGTPPSTLLHPYLRNKHATLVERDDLSVMGMGSRRDTAIGAASPDRDGCGGGGWAVGTPLNNSWKTDTGLQNGKSLTAEEEDEVRRSALAEITRMYKVNGPGNGGRDDLGSGGGGGVGAFDNFVRGQKLFERRRADKEAVRAAGKENPSTVLNAAGSVQTPRGKEYMVGPVAGTPSSGESASAPWSTPRGAAQPQSLAFGPSDLSPIFLLESGGAPASSSPLAIKGTKMHSTGDSLGGAEEDSGKGGGDLVRTLEFPAVTGTRLASLSSTSLAAVPEVVAARAAEGVTPPQSSASSRGATPHRSGRWTAQSSRTCTPTTPQCGFVDLDDDLVLTQRLADPSLDDAFVNAFGAGLAQRDAVMHSPASSISIDDSDTEDVREGTPSGRIQTMSETAWGLMGAEQRLCHESRSLVKDLHRGIGEDCSPLLERRLWRPREMFSDLVSGILSEVADNCRAGVKAPSPMPVRRQPPGHSRGGSRARHMAAGQSGSADSPGRTPASRRRPEKAKSRLNFVMLEGEDDGRTSVTPEMGASRPNLRSPPMFSPPISPMEGSTLGYASPGYSPQVSGRTPRTPGGGARPGSQSPLRFRARWCPAGLF